jgi:PBP1b-binding outer membrane lipoprotein LpoB
MANKKIWLGMLPALAIFLAGCSSPPPIRPALSQTVINVQRSSTNLDSGNLLIYVDDIIVNKDAPIKKGQYWTYPVNNGVHYIHGVCGKLVSEAINFSANNQTVSFVATIEKEPGLFGKKKLVITRSTVSNDTGRQTDLDIQESYGDVQ